MQTINTSIKYQEKSYFTLTEKSQTEKVFFTPFMIVNDGVLRLRLLQ